jgi:hypothetical protein
VERSDTHQSRFAFANRDIERQPFAHHARANRQHVGIVVLADHAG